MKNVFYPKQISKIKAMTIENQCFFAMPFSEQYTNLYDTLVLYMENAGYRCIRVDNNLSASVPIINLILNGIATSQYVIVDISEINANVFYELGITHTIKDFDNVFIIKEKNANTPFDIQHLQYIAYDKNHLKVLANELLKRLKANQYKNSFKRIVLSKQLIGNNKIDEFVEYFTKIFSEKQVNMYTALLEDNISKIEKDLVINAIWDYDKILRDELNKKDSYIHIDNLFLIFNEILLPCYLFDEIKIFINDFLNCKQYSSLFEKELLPYQTNLSINFAEKARLLDIVAKWIVEYFQRSKSTKVDLNRYKLEAFLLKTELEKVNEYIANAIVSDNKYIREHMADIVGEKKLYIAEDNLITQLRRETNIYTTSSIVEALGKLNSQKALETIKVWLDNNAQEIISNGNFFVLKHFRNAIIKIDSTKTLKEFDSIYLDILVKNNTI